MFFVTVELINFQGHEYSRFDLENNFTCIIGENNHGKSSIIRAIDFVYFDLWDKTFVRNGAEFAEVRITKNDGTTVIRRKGDSVNEFEIEKHGESIEKYANFGRLLPDEVREKLELKPVKIDLDREEKLNIARQFDPPFLIFDSGPAKLKVLNKITGANIIDAAQRELNRDKKRLMAKSRELEEMAVDTEQRLKDFVNVDVLKGKLDIAAQHVKKIEELVEREADIVRIYERFKLWKASYSNYKQAKKLIDGVNLNIVKTLKGESSRLLELEQLWKKVNKNNVSLYNNRDDIRSLKEDYDTTRQRVLDILEEEKICPTCYKDLGKEELETILEKRYTV